MSGEFKVDGDKVTLFVSDTDVWSNTSRFKSHRDYLAYRFKNAGVEILQWHTTVLKGTGVTIPGVKYMRTDSEISTTLEITATIGVNARWIIGHG